MSGQKISTVHIDISTRVVPSNEKFRVITKPTIFVNAFMEPGEPALHIITLTFTTLRAQNNQ